MQDSFVLMLILHWQFIMLVHAHSQNTWWIGETGLWVKNSLSTFSGLNKTLIHPFSPLLAPCIDQVLCSHANCSIAVQWNRHRDRWQPSLSPIIFKVRFCWFVNTSEHGFAFFAHLGVSSCKDQQHDWLDQWSFCNFFALCSWHPCKLKTRHQCHERPIKVDHFTMAMY